jgi:hypothetical protein
MSVSVNMPHKLTSFTACTVISSLTCEVSRNGDLLDLLYVLCGDLPQISWPASAAAPQRRLRLWEHTCFEAFIRRPDDDAYIETNASPSGDWHCFRFSAYRADMQVASMPTLQVLDCAVNQSQASLRVQFDLTGWLKPADPLQLGLAAVIQTSAPCHLYYALCHTASKPDFHHRDSHTLLIPGVDHDNPLWH